MSPSSRKNFLAASGALAVSTLVQPAPTFAQTPVVPGKPSFPLANVKADADLQVVLDDLLSFHEPPLTSLEPQPARELATFADALRDVLSREGKRCVEPVGEIRHVVAQSPVAQLLMRVYKPAISGPLPVVVYFHGGGFVIANLDTYDASPRSIANAAKCIVISVAYHQAPEHPFPAAVEDAYFAYTWALQNAASLGGDPSRIAVAGESAGGNLAAVVANVARMRGSRPPIHQVLVYPVTEFGIVDTPSKKIYADAFPLNTAQLKYFGKLYLKKPSDAYSALASPIRADLRGVAPATIVNAEIDPLRDDGLIYERALRKAGVAVTRTVYPGMTHEFFGMSAQVTKARQARDEVAAALKRAFGTR